MYEIGDYIVKSANGVCRVEDIVQPDFSVSNKDKLYYLLIPLDDANGKVYMPVDTKDTTVRMVMSEQEAWELIDQIKDIAEASIDNDKQKEQIYKEAIRSNDPKKLIEIIKSAYLRKQKRIKEGKKSTVVDDRYLSIAEKNLYAELGFVLKKDKDELYEIIMQKCN